MDRKTISLTGLTISTLLLITACAKSEQEPPRTTPIGLMTVQVADSMPAALLEGTLERRTTDSEPCWTLETEGGKYLLLFLPGAYEGDERVHAAEASTAFGAGQTVILAGGEWASNEHADRTKGCGASARWLVTAIDGTVATP